MVISYLYVSFIEESYLLFLNRVIPLLLYKHIQQRSAIAAHDIVPQPRMSPYYGNNAQ